MSSTDAKFAKRKLDFLDKPLHCKSFFVDVKAETLRRKIIRKIKELGGHVEGFLSKDIDLFITDKKSEVLERATSKGAEKTQISSQNLSRGRALLMKACAKTNSKTTVQNNSNIKNAINLGLKVEQASVFYKECSKLTQCVKKSSRKTTEIDGIVPLEWKENEKENKCCIKVEDTDQLYKPLFKDFDTLPTLFYNDEVASPFVKGVVLTKHKEKAVNRYSTAKKTENVKNKGGFCEACDYWYKCSLREHIKSAKHEKFVKDQTNFEILDSIINKLPSVSDFVKKLDIISGTLKTHSPSDILPQSISQQISIQEILENNQKRKEKIVPDECDMPSIAKEQTDLIGEDFVMMIGNADGKNSPVYKNISNNYQNEELLSEPVAYSEHVMLDCEMPLLQKEYINNSQDSGTGPEVPELTLSNHTALKRTNSDSALPPDDDIPMCCSPNINIDCSNDNAVFMDNVYKSTNQLLENVTSTVRRRFSMISLLEDVNCSEKSETASFSFGNIKIDREKMTMKHEGSVCFSDVTSPNSKVEKKFDFNDLALNWLKDIGKQNNHQKKNQQFRDLSTESRERTKDMNCEYSSATEEYDPTEYKFHKSSLASQPNSVESNNISETVNNHTCSSDLSTENYSYEDFKCSAIKRFSSAHKNNRREVINPDENSCSLDNVSLISMPDTPKTTKMTHFGISEDSNSLSFIGDDTLCDNNYVITGATPIRTITASELNCRITGSELSNQSDFSHYSGCRIKTTESEQKPIRIKINLSDIKKKEKKKKRKVKVKRRIFPAEEMNKENENSFYLTQESDTKIKIRKVARTPVQKNGDLMTYWKVRKSDGCRLVFSSEKRKASYLDTDYNTSVVKRRKCIDF